MSHQQARKIVPRNMIGCSEIFLSLANDLLPALLFVALLLQRSPPDPDFNRYHCMPLTFILAEFACWLFGDHSRKQNERRWFGQAVIDELIKYHEWKQTMANLLIQPANMDVDLPIVISDEEETGTAGEPIVLDSSDEEGDEAEHENEAVEDNFLEEFHLFTELPIELRLQIWNLAFPARIVNLTYDESQGRFLSFNSSPPLLLQIHRETRDLALQTYRRYFGNGSSVECGTWIDFGRDVILMNDDYVDGEFLLTEDSDDDNPPIHLGFAPELVQNFAFSVDHFCHKDADDRRQGLMSMVHNILEKFTSVKKLYIVYEDGVNPYSRGRIRFFPMERTCLTTCDSKGCINIAMIRADCQDSIDGLRKSKAVLGKAVDVQFVGAWRGGSREEYGHALDDYEDESDDEYHDPEDDPKDGYASDDMETPDEIRGNVDFASGNALAYDAADEEVTFSDHEGWKNPDFIPEHELQDLKDDEKAYRALLEEGEYYDLKQGQFLTLTLRDPEDYYEWRKKEHPGKCYPIFHPNGSYAAV